MSQPCDTPCMIPMATLIRSVKQHEESLVCFLDPSCMLWHHTLLFSRHVQSQGLLFKHRCDKFISRPGQSQGPLHKHLHYFFSESQPSPPKPLQTCHTQMARDSSSFKKKSLCNIGLGHPKSRRISKLHCWFKSYGNFAEVGGVCLLYEFHQEGSVPSSCVEGWFLNQLSPCNPPLALRRRNTQVVEIGDLSHKIDYVAQA